MGIVIKSILQMRKLEEHEEVGYLARVAEL